MLAQTLVIFVAFFSLSDAAITAWTKPSIATASGNGSISPAIPENTAVGKTSITIEATDNGTEKPIYKIVKQDVADLFMINMTSGELSIKKALNFETHPRHVIYVTAAVGGKPALATATVTVTVGDVNESPTFTTKSAQVCLADHTAKGTRVTTVTATDEDTQSSFNSITYSITAGNGRTDFGIAGNNGTVTVAKALNVTKTPSYNLTIEANTATIFLLVKVGGCGSSAAIMAPLGLLTLLVALLAASM